MDSIAARNSRRKKFDYNPFSYAAYERTPKVAHDLLNQYLFINISSSMEWYFVQLSRGFSSLAYEVEPPCTLLDDQMWLL
jgi:hypothetical protein